MTTTALADDSAFPKIKDAGLAKCFSGFLSGEKYEAKTPVITRSEGLLE